MSRDAKPERLAALKHRDFRLLWFGQLFSSIGSEMQVIAITWHVFTLLRGTTTTVTFFGYEWALSMEALGLGALGLVRVVPVVGFALLGGIVADIRDRRAIMMVSQAIQTVMAIVLAGITLTGNASLGLLYLLTAIDSAANAFDEPARQALVPNLVPEEHLTNAVSLNMLLIYAGTIFGPALAGQLIGLYDIGTVYGLNAVSFIATLGGLALMRHRGRPAESGGGVSWASIREGVRFTYRSKIIWGSALLDFMATFFASARTMLPIISDSVLGMGVAGYGLLATAQPVGAVLAGAVMSLRRDMRRQGVTLFASVVVYGAATALFGWSTAFWVSYVLLGLTGAGDMVSTVIRGTIRQVVSPDRLRGRVTSVSMVFFMGGPKLGELEAGVVAAAFGAPFAIVTGGIATIVGTLLLAWRYPELRRYVGSAEQIAEARSVGLD